MLLRFTHLSYINGPAYFRGSDRSVFSDSRSLSNATKKRCNDREIKWPSRIPRMYRQSISFDASNERAAEPEGNKIFVDAMSLIAGCRTDLQSDSWKIQFISSLLSLITSLKMCTSTGYLKRIRQNAHLHQILQRIRRQERYYVLEQRNVTDEPAF